MLARKLLLAAGALAVAVGFGWLGWSWHGSRLPGTYNVMEYGTVEYGDGPRPHVRAHGAGTRPHVHGRGRSVSVRDLAGPPGKADVRVTLTAQKAPVRLRSGRTIDAWTFDGVVPGPELRVRQGDLLEVVLVNEDIDDGVSIHWHGVDVPNGEDGVAGVTQDAVMPGRRHTYRFRADQVGTFWYHSHQDAENQVRRGLYGALVIEPRRPTRKAGLDLTVIAHDFGRVQVLGTSDGIERRAVPHGTAVRLRIVNSDNAPRHFSLTGTPFRVVAIDGADLHGPASLEGRTLDLAAGGRYDVVFTMPRTPVELALRGSRAALTLSADGREDLPAAPRLESPKFDALAHGTAKKAPFGRSSRFDRTFTLTIGRKPAFRDGHPGLQWALNGKVFPDVPTFVLERGDLVKLVLHNRTKTTHPMHLHGHHLLVLARDGRPARGSPWWVDSLDVRPGERYEVAFRARNPGLWMLHCHNLQHSADGLTMHVAYAGVTTPYRVGGSARNDPE